MGGLEKKHTRLQKFKKICAAAFASVAFATGVVGCEARSPAGQDSARGVATDTVGKKSAVVPADPAPRSLAPGEAALLQAVFDNFNPALVRVHERYGKKEDLAGDVSCQKDCTIIFYGVRKSVGDYSRADIDRFGDFVHLATHAWHKQQGKKLHYGPTEGYKYPLDKKFSFDNYGYQQQSAIIEDYARRFLHPGRTMRWASETYDEGMFETDSLLQQLVENKFPRARQARLAFSGPQFRPVNADEKKLARGLFGEGFEPGRLSHVFHKEEYKDAVASVSNDSEIDYWGQEWASANFSCDAPEKFGNYVHESLHHWQKQTGWVHTQHHSDRKEGEDAYFYRLGPDLAFEDYTDERQAALVEDYARLYLHPGHSLKWLSQTEQWQTHPHESAVMLQKVVEDFFPAARHARLAYEQTEQAAKGKAVPFSCSQKLS